MNKFISYLLSFFVSISMVFCVSEAGAVWLLIAPGAAAQGTGEAQVAKATDAYTSHFNPAGLSFIKGDEIVLQHVNWLPNLADDIYFDFIGFNQHIGSGTIGGHLIYMNLGTQQKTSSSGGDLGTFRSYMAALALGYSTTLNPHSSIGFNFKIFHQRLADEGVAYEGGIGSGEGASSDLAFDFGYLLKFGKSKQNNFGLAIQNIGPPIDFVDSEQADPAPTNMKIGFDLLLHSTENTKLRMLFDMNKLLVASYVAMDWDGNGYIDGSSADPNGLSNSDEQAHKDEWYKGVFNAWLDDWYYGGDYDESFSDEFNDSKGIINNFWYMQHEGGSVFEEYADGRIGGYKQESWRHVMLNPTDDVIGDNGDNLSTSWYSDTGNATATSGLVYAPNYSGFCEETYRSFTGLSDEGSPNYFGQDGSMCYDANGVRYNPNFTYEENQNNFGYVSHAWIDMPNDGFGEVDVFDANCDPESNYDCYTSTDWNNNGLTGLVDIGDPSITDLDPNDELYATHDGDGICDDNETNCILVNHNGVLTNGEILISGPANSTRMDLAYDRTGDGRGEYAFNESEYGRHNPYGYEEKGSGDDRSFKDELEEIIYNFGLEYNYSSNFILRAGFIYDLEGDIKSPTLGAGIKFNNYGFDFGYTAGDTDHPRTNTMFFSLSLGIGA